MKIADTKTSRFAFLQGGGEMGALTRSFDWSLTPVGPVEEWPQSLRTTVGIILHSDFPMFLWWGTDMIQFYNDGYRPSLGDNGKHPYALGQKGKECWPEIWDIIYPLIEKVRTKRESFFLEDQLVPIFRNGKIEDVYWTFSYSPVLNDTGIVEGVLVVCNETTKKVQAVQEIAAAQKRLAQSEANLVNVFMQAPSAMAILDGPDHMYRLANEKYMRLIGTDRNVVGLPIREALPEIAGAGFYELLDEVYKTGEPYVGSEVLVMLDREGDGVLSEAFVDFVYQPYYSGNNEISGILVHAVDVTEAVRARRSIEQSELNLRNIIQQSPVAMCIFKGPDHILEIGNERIYELWGKSGEELLGRPIFEALHEAKGQGFEQLLNEVYSTGRTFTAYGLPINLPRTGGVERVYVNFVYEPFRDESGNVTGVMAVATDVTEQVTAAKKVEESELRLRNIVSEATVATAIYSGRDMVIEYANDAMISVWGKDRSVIGKTLKEALPELEGQPFHQLLDDVYTSGETYWGKEDKVDLMINGKLQSGYFNFTYKPLRDLSGQVYGILNMAVDVTDQFLYKAQVERNEARLRNLIMKAPVAMCLLVGATHVIETANDFMIDLWGKSRGGLMNKPLFEALPDLRNQGLEQLLQKVFQTGMPYSAHERPGTLLRNGRQEVIYQNFVYEPYRNADGNIIGVLVISNDVTYQVLARQKIEEVVAERTRQLAAINKDLQRSNEELAQFAYIASHDLQEPARKITTFIEMLGKSLGDIDDRSRRYIDKIETSSLRMLALIRDVLTFSQISTVPRDLEKIDLNEVLKEVIDDFELTIEEKRAKIETSTLPVIHGIPVQISQLFNNLISNSLKFVPKERTPLITIKASTLNDADVAAYPSLSRDLKYALITVTDNGIGFNQANAEQIFDIFQRLHGKAEYEGTGIGLAICKKIVQNHNGHIFATSVKGEGATFYVILPISQSR